MLEIRLLWLYLMMLFKEILGQKSIKERLVKSVADSRISHAQLFLGPEGCGALPLALAYAQYILCENKKAGDSCGACPSCTKSQKWVHPDIHFVYPLVLQKDVKKSTDLVGLWREALNENPYMNISDWLKHLSLENKQPIIGVKESGDILQKLSLSAYEGEYKILLLWLPEKLHHAAGNKLLKILEEPPAKTLFLLVSENEEGILPTLVSRTQLVKINRLPDEVIREALAKQFQLDNEDASRLAYLADGSYNMALKLKDQDEDASFFLEQFRTWMRLCLKADMQGISSWVEIMGTAQTGRVKQKEFLHYGLHIIRECLMIYYADDSLIRADGEEFNFIKKLSGVLDGNKCKKLAKEFELAIYHIERNGNGKIIFTDLTLSCMKTMKQVQKVQG